jgi:hypothetical protein
MASTLQVDLKLMSASVPAAKPAAVSFSPSAAAGVAASAAAAASAKVDSKADTKQASASNADPASGTYEEMKSQLPNVCPSKD